MAGNDREAVVDRHALGEDMGRGPVEIAQVGDEIFMLAPGGGGGRPIERRRIPRGDQSAPSARPSFLDGIEIPEELLIAVPAPLRPGLLDDRGRLEDRRPGGFRMELGDVVGVAAEQPAFERRRADHVVGDEEELLPSHPGVVLGDDVGELGDAPGLGLPQKDERQHCHEVALTGAEAPVQVGAAAGPVGERVLDEG